MLFSPIKNKWWLIVLLTILLTVLYNFWYQTEVICIKNPKTSYTHIIVGAGTTGCVLAAYLSENKNNTVLLIEAGGHFNIFSKVPVLGTFIQRSTTNDWLYKTETQEWSSTEFNERKQCIPRGKGLGGTGQMNFMVHNIDYENYWNMWKSIGGDIGDNISEILNKLRSYEINLRTNICDYQKYLFFGRAKEWPNLKSKTSYPMHLKKTSSYLGYIFDKAITELKENKLKYRPCLSTIYQGQRWSTYYSHLRQASGRHNLHILCYTEVTKIIFSNKRAVGIQIHKDTTNYIIYSKTEIILSTGTINTPKLLLLSGIGNLSELQRFNITSIADVPGVGLNLHDHFYTPLYVTLKKPISVTLTKLLNFNELYRYIFYRNGLFAESPIVGVAHHASNLSILLFGMGSVNEYIFREVANYLPQAFRSIFPFYNDYQQEGIIFLAGCSQPKSRGFLKLKINDPFSSPFIDPQYLSNEYDILCMINAVKLINAIVETPSFKSIGANIQWPNLQACTNYRRNVTDDKYLECIVRAISITAYHQAGTCKIGKNDDLYYVVDQEFKVRGVTGLRIVDASILPTPAALFPNAFLVAVAEYAAKLM